MDASQGAGLRLAGLPTAHVPSILTAAGTAVALATVYALYGLIDPALAFVLLGILALATLAARGARAGRRRDHIDARRLRQSERLGLYIYLAVVTAASFALARARLWRWLAVTAIVFGVCELSRASPTRACPRLAPMHSTRWLALRSRPG